MSITSDVRSYADSLLQQSKQVIGQAQARLTEVPSDASGLADKAATRASETYSDLRTKGEALRERVSALPAVDQVSSTMEPYVAQLNGYRVALIEKVEQLYAELKTNDQVARVLGVAEQATGAIVGTVNERLVNPVRSRLERESDGEHAATLATPGDVTVPAEVTVPAQAAVPAKAATPTKATTATKTTSAAKATPAKRSTTPRKAES